MSSKIIVSPSDLTDSTFPVYINESYERFVEFMTLALESEERMGFGQDILQKLTVYRDFETYKRPITEFTHLKVPINEISESTEETYLPAQHTELGENILTGRRSWNGLEEQRLISVYEDEKLIVENGEGFPLYNGILLIDEEIILYRYRKDNVFYELERGAAATTELGDLVSPSVYKTSEPAPHYHGVRVYNISALFLSGILNLIHKTYCSPIQASKVAKPIDRATILKYIRDFFRAKGTKLGIKALFKILFAENDVDVRYPGDRMIIPSKSTWYEGKLVRTVPIAFELSNPEYPYVSPDKMLGRRLELKSYNSDKVYGSIVVDYVSKYAFENEDQYEIWVEKHNIKGDTVANPNTVLTRDLHMYGTHDDGMDVYTITVESTLGFPDSGVLIIEREAIHYESKSFNQFFRCKRGHIGVDFFHERGTEVYGPYYYEGITKIDGVEHMSRSFPLGLVQDVDIRDPGLLHETTDDVTPNGPGRIDPRDPIMGSFMENYDDALVDISNRVLPVRYFGDFSAGVNGVFFDKTHSFVASSNLPYSIVGPFCKKDSITLGQEDRIDLEGEDGSLLIVENRHTDIVVGPEIRGSEHLHVIPRRNEIKVNNKINQQIRDKGTDAIGVCIDGVPYYSNVAPYSEHQGMVAKYNIENPGAEYVNPTLVVNEDEVEEIIRLDENGRVMGISTSQETNYGLTPDVRVSSGEEAVAEFKFDLYGRITEVLLLNGGRFYKDVPSFTALDKTGRGKGAVFSVTTENDAVVSVEIVHPGIDYNSNETHAVFTPVGGGAEVTATIQYYRYDRHFEIDNSPNWFYDEGSGFPFEDKRGTRANYAYVRRPDWISEKNGDDPLPRTQHSPIMGWAFDGNPIYGPIGYANKRDDGDGYTHYRSSYMLRENRNGIIPSGHDVPREGTMPPGEEAFPMGTFVEDYEYDPIGSIGKLRERYIISSETPENLITDKPQWITYGRLPDKIDGEYPGLLDEYNSVVCNTPEYPKELYPDGVRCYFLTVDYALQPEFPYVIGWTFYNRPLSQHMRYVINSGLEPVDTLAKDPMSSYDETELVFNYDKVDRYRNPYLQSTKEELEIEVADTLDGGVSAIIVEDGLPATNKVGDIVLYDNEDTGGAGAEGRISFIKGIEVEDAFGSDIETVVLSHIQIINVKACVHLDLQGDNVLTGQTFVFEKGSTIQTSSGAKAVVFNYDPDTTDLVVKTYTKNLIQYGEFFRDNRDQLIKIPRLEDIDSGNFDLQVINTFKSRKEPFVRDDRPNKTIMSVVPPDTEIEDLVAGDLWFSIQNGRLYIWYVDEDGTEQWVVTQPTGTIPMLGALDMAIGDDQPVERGIISAWHDNVVTISNWAPSERIDGSPPQYGDFWWSPHTKILYMFYEYEWISTDPNGMTPIQASLDIPNWPTPERIHPWKHSYETSLDVLVTLEEPKSKSDGSPLEEGVLWFSPVTGKTYIRYRSNFGHTWIQTNPLGMMPNEYALDDIPGDSDTIDPPPLRPGPETDPGDWDDENGSLARKLGINYIWFEQLKYFRPEDTIQMYNGAPGTSANEKATIISIAEGGAPAAAVLRRGDPKIEKLMDRTPTFNRSRYLFTVRTVVPHLIRPGDYVYIEDASEDLLNGLHEVIDAGFIIPAQAHTVVENGQVVDVIIDFPGAYYREDFFIFFYSGGGVGGYAKCIVEPLSRGGRIKEIEVIYGGLHYEFEAKIIWPEVLDAHEFAIFLPEKLDQMTDFKYSTNSKYPQNEATYVEVTSRGVGYERMPAIEGIYKQEIARAEVEIEMRGTSIHKVNVIDPGARYKRPRVIVYDRSGYGRGAELTAVVENEGIKEIVVMEGGDLYLEPYIVIVENQGKYISVSDDIGRLGGFNVLDPGRNISSDRSLKPELHITTRVVISKPTGEFEEGERVYQGIPAMKVVEATVVGYEPETQILILDQVDGNLRAGEDIVSDSGAAAMVVCNGQADTSVVIDGISSQLGEFLDDTSKVSESYAVLQDSYYFQWFSYVISSPLVQSKYDTFVKNIVHPSGFIMFSDLTVHEFTDHQFQAHDVELTINN